MAANAGTLRRSAVKANAGTPRRLVEKAIYSCFKHDIIEHIRNWKSDVDQQKKIFARTRGVLKQSDLSIDDDEQHSPG